MKQKKEKPKLIFILDSFSYGGATSLLKQYISLTNNISNAHVFAGTGNISNVKEYFKKIKCSIVPSEIETDIRLVSWSHSLFSQIEKEVKSSQYILHVITFYSALAACLHPFSWNKKIIYYYGGDFPLERRSQYKKNPINEIIFLLLRLLQYIILIRSNQIITVTRYCKEILTQNYPFISEKKIKIITPFSQIKAKRKISKNCLNMLHVTRFEPRKGTIELLYACKELEKSGVDFHLTIAGPLDSYFVTEVLRTYEKLNLLNKVSFLHKVNIEQRDSLFEKSDLFIMPSQDLETFGIVILEAMAKGLVVIGTPVGAIPETLKKIDERLICKSSSPKQIYNKIIWYKNLNKKDFEILKRKIETNFNKYLVKTNQEELMKEVYSRQD